MVNQIRFANLLHYFMKEMYNIILMTNANL